MGHFKKRLFFFENETIVFENDRITKQSFFKQMKMLTSLDIKIPILIILQNAIINYQNISKGIRHKYNQLIFLKVIIISIIGLNYHIF